MCGNEYRVNKLQTAVYNTAPYWHFDLTHGKWNSDILCSGTWFGFTHGEFVGSISTSLYGQGNASLTFGNCWDTGEVKLFLNEIEISSVGPHSQKTVVFYFDNSVMKLEEHGVGIIEFVQFEISQCNVGCKSYEILKNNFNSQAQYVELA